MPGSTKTNEAVGLSAGVLHLCGYQSHPRSLVALSSTLRRPLIWSAILCVSSFRVAHRCGAYFPPPPPAPSSPIPLPFVPFRAPCSFTAHNSGAREEAAMPYDWALPALPFALPFVAHGNRVDVIWAATNRKGVDRDNRDCRRRHSPPSRAPLIGSWTLAVPSWSSKWRHMAADTPNDGQ